LTVFWCTCRTTNPEAVPKVLESQRRETASTPLWYLQRCAVNWFRAGRPGEELVEPGQNSNLVDIVSDIRTVGKYKCTSTYRGQTNCQGGRRLLRVVRRVIVVRIAEVSATAAVQDEGEGSVTQQGTVSCWYLHTRNCVVCSALLSLSPRASESISCPIALTLSHSVSHHHLLLPSDTRGVQRMTSTQSRKSSLSSSRRVLQTVARSLMDSLPLTRFPFPSHCPHSLVVQSHTSRSHSTLLPTASMLTQSSTRSRHPESECAAVLTLHRMLLACNVCVCVCVCV
jgi:hypothetical protein